MKVLVVGGAGYIGSHTTFQLIEKGHEVVIFDNLTTGNKEAIHPSATLVVGDLRNKDDVEQLFKVHSDVDIVMHFAAKIVVPESVEKPLEYYENNVHGVGVLLEKMLKYNIKNVMFSSTAAVYGEPDQTTPLEENATLQPINPYGTTKKNAEEMIQSVAYSDDMKYVIFRYFNVAGADKNGEIGLSPKTPVTHLIPIINEAVLGMREKMYIFGDDYPTADGTCVRDYIHIMDLAAAHVMGAEYLVEKQENQIINLGSEAGFSVKEVVEQTRKTLNLDFTVEIKERRAGDPAKLVASNKKAKEILGWSPKLTLADMIEDDYKWRKQPKYSNR